MNQSRFSNLTIFDHLGILTAWSGGKDHGGISPGSLQTTEIPFLRAGGKRRICKEDALCIQSFRSVVDVREKEAAFLLEADLPGVKKEDISLDVNDGVLTISADINQEKKETKEGYVCNERRCGHVERSFNLEGIDVGAIKADYRHGVLMVRLPKEKTQEKKNGFKIAIGDEANKLSDGE